MKLRSTLPVCLCLLLVAVLPACGGAPEPSQDEAPAAAQDEGGGDGGDVQVYETRGQVTALPDPADPLTNLRIRHEPIHDFVSIDGEVVGMNSMNMPFPVAEGVGLEGIEVGDPVSFTLEVDWDGDPAYQVTRIEALPEGTELTWGDAVPPSGTGSATESATEDDTQD